MINFPLGRLGKVIPAESVAAAIIAGHVYAGCPPARPWPPTGGPSDPPFRADAPPRIKAESP